MRIKNFNQWISIAVLSSICLTVSAQEQATSPELQPVTLQLKWTHAFQFAGYYMALHNGYYREAGLDVEIRPGGPNVDVIGQVLSGEADFGVATSDLLLDYAAGKSIKVLGVIYQHSPVILIMKGDKPSGTMQDLVGKTIMIETHAADLFAMFKRVGVPLDQLNCMDHTGFIDDLLTSEAQAIFAYMGNEPYLLDQMGVPYFILSPRTYGIDFYGDNFFTTQSMLEDDEEVVNGFREATIRGWRDAIENPEAAVDLILEHYPTPMSRDHLLYEARITQDLMTQLVTPGYMLTGRWEHIANTYIEIGMLDEMPDLDGFIYQTEPTALPQWAWEAALGGGAILLLLVFLSIYFRTLNFKLRKEVERRRKMEERILTVNRDLQNAKLTAEEASRKKTWFIANVSHDLRAPISSIIGLANIFRHHANRLDLPEEFHQFLEQLDSSGEFLMLMLNNVLDLSSFEMNAAMVRLEQLPLSEWCDSISNLVQPLASEHGVQVQFKRTLSRDVIEADRTRLSQILLNLIHNAIKFSPENGIVFVEVALQSDTLLMTVRDQGPGIPKEERAKIFHIFEQGTEGPSHKSGTGLGLSIVQRNTKLLHGNIRIEGAQPVGAQFCVEIPLNLSVSQANSPISQKNVSTI
jgi:signal transduction histidine kinase